MMITPHAAERLKERYNVRNADKLAGRALEQGLQRTDTTGSLRRYLDKLYFSHDFKANNLRVYGRLIFVFRDESLITVLNLPQEYSKTVDKIVARR